MFTNVAWDLICLMKFEPRKVVFSVTSQCASDIITRSIGCGSVWFHLKVQRSKLNSIKHQIDSQSDEKQCDKLGWGWCGKESGCDNLQFFWITRFKQDKNGLGFLFFGWRRQQLDCIRSENKNFGQRLLNGETRRKFCTQATLASTQNNCKPQLIFDIGFDFFINIFL